MTTDLSNGYTCRTCAGIILGERPDHGRCADCLALLGYASPTRAAEMEHDRLVDAVLAKLWPTRAPTLTHAGLRRALVIQAARRIATTQQLHEAKVEAVCCVVIGWLAADPVTP